MASSTPPASFHLVCVSQMFFFVIQTPQTSISLSITLFSNLPLSGVCVLLPILIFFLLASLRYGFFFATLPRRSASRSRLFTVDVETGVLRVLFNYLTPLSILVRASLRCSVKGVVHSVVRDLQFLGNFSHGIVFISQNKNRLTSFRRKLFVSGHFEPVIEPTIADAPDTQLVSRRPVLLLL